MGLRINHNLASLGASMNLGRANAALSSSLSKLSTGLKINSASDGPADLIISEKMRAQINAISKATENTQNAISMLSTAEGSLNEVNSLLSKMQGLALKAAQSGTQSTDEIAASQAEIDAALESINNISRNTSFGSLNLLDGSKSIQTASVDTKNILVDIDKANFAGDTKAINVNVVTASKRAATSIDFSAGAQGSATGTDGVLTNTQVLKVTGNRGSDTMTFSAGSAIAEVAKEINSRVTQTGVYAEVNQNKLNLYSAKYGASEYVSVEDVDGTNNLLDIKATAPATSTPNTTYEIDLTQGGLGQQIAIGRNVIRTTGELGDRFSGYKVVVNHNFAGTTVAVNDAAKEIRVGIERGVTDAAAIATELTNQTSVVWAVDRTGAESTSGVFALTGAYEKTDYVTSVKSNLVITGKAGSSAATHAEPLKLIINSTNILKNAATASYNATTNTLTLDVGSASGTYSAGDMDTLVANAVTAGQAGVRSLFDFKISGGYATINATSSNKAIVGTKIDVDTRNKSIDLSTNTGMGKVFNAGTGSKFAFKLTAEGEKLYSDYTVTYKTGQLATAVTVDDGAKKININVIAAGATNAALVTALNGALGAGMAVGTGYNDGLTNVVNNFGTATGGFVTDASQLTVTAKDNADASFQPRILISATAAAATIAYTAATQTVVLKLDNTDGANMLDTQAELETLLNNSADGAKLRSLFNFTVSGAVQGTTLGTIAIGEGGGASGQAITTTNAIKATGTDGVLEVNGIKTAANNLTYTFDNGNIRGNITVDEKFNVAGKTTSFKLTGKGAYLQIGSKSQLSHQIGVGITSVSANQLATGLYLDRNMNTSTATIDDSTLYTTATLADITSGGKFDLAKDAQTAYDIISKAISEVSVSRAKLGALISNTLESNINSLGVAFENLTASESRVRDVDFATETANFTRSQILVQAGTSVASQANVATQAALQLLK